MSVEPVTSSVATIDTAIPLGCPIEKLPNELLLLVFHHCDRHLMNRIRLTHTCQRWRPIAISTSALWTSLHPSFYHDGSESSARRFNAYLALLRIQHDRAEGQLLDVNWSIDGKDHESQILSLLNELDSFRRWRTLYAHFAPKDTPWYRESDYPNLNFENLERLEVISRYLHPVVGAIDRTITSKFKFVRMDSKDISPYQVQSYCQNMIEQVSHLSIRTSIYKPLSPNVTSVVAAEATIADPNHVKSYILLYCSFGTVTLQHLTDLTVRNMIEVQDSCAVSLPSLRNLECMIVTLRGSATFDTPTLEKLVLNGGRDMAAKMVIDNIPLHGDAIAPGRSSRDYLYVPSTHGDLVIWREWSATELIRFLEWSPHAERVSLSLHSDDDVRKVLEYLLEQPYPQGVPGLTELKLRGPYESRDLNSMAGLADRLVRRRKEDLGVTLTVYGYEWMTGGKFVPLV